MGEIIAPARTLLRLSETIAGPFWAEVADTKPLYDEAWELYKQCRTPLNGLAACHPNPKVRQLAVNLERELIRVTNHAWKVPATYADKTEHPKLSDPSRLERAEERYKTSFEACIELTEQLAKELYEWAQPARPWS